MNAQAERFRKITMKVLTMQLNSVTLMDLMAYGGAGLGIISAVSAFAKGQLSLTATLTIVLLAADFFLPLRLLGSYFHIAMNGAASAEKIFKLLAAEEPADGEQTVPEQAALQLEYVTFGYEKDRTVLQDVSLTIPQGSFVSLVGESGCGKSTIAALLSGSRTDYTGSVTLGGVPVEQLQRAHKIDFDDMLVMCWDLFRKRPDILSAWQKKYEYILVDEFQDINRLQYQIVRMLAAPSDNLFIVGDDDQSIYRFRGAKPEIMLGFEKDFPGTKRVLLGTNYRVHKGDRGDFAEAHRAQ